MYVIKYCFPNFIVPDLFKWNLNYQDYIIKTEYSVYLFMTAISFQAFLRKPRVFSSLEVCTRAIWNVPTGKFLLTMYLTTELKTFPISKKKNIRNRKKKWNKI